MNWVSVASPLLLLLVHATNVSAPPTIGRISKSQ